MGLEMKTRRSLVCIKKRVGESTEPWGTPAFIGRDFESAPSATHLIERLLRELEIQLQRSGLSPKEVSVFERAAWQNLLNVSELSETTARVSSYFSIFEFLR